MKTMIIAAAGCALFAAFAQTPPTDANTAAPPAAACDRSASAPQWLPCGPDRMLSESDLKTYVIKEGMVTKMVLISGTNGKPFYATFHPDGKLESGFVGGGDFGKSWTMEGNKICRSYYQFFRGPQCGPFELKEGKLYMVDPDQRYHSVTSIEFVKK
jgi:hypothetical protein